LAKIYIDTNIFMDLYQSAQDRLGVFDEVAMYSTRLVLTSLTLNEFKRNRVGVLRQLSTLFENSIALTPYTTSILQENSSYKELIVLRDSLKRKADEVKQYLEGVASDVTNDPVAAIFFAIASNKEVTVFEVNDTIISRAHRRKLLGIPPTSVGRQTIGDEVIWECLTGNMVDDLAIVTRDATYHDNNEFLAEEFKGKTGKRLLLVTRKISEALKIIGETPSNKLVSEEEKLESADKDSYCRKCGSEMEVEGYEGSDGDEAWWYRCPVCHTLQFPD